MPSWSDMVQVWQSSNTKSLNSYSDRYKKAQAEGLTGSALYNRTLEMAKQDGTPPSMDFPTQNPATSPVSKGLAQAATAVKQTAPSPSPALAPQGSPPNNQLKASQDLGAALSGQPAQIGVDNPRKRINGMGFGFGGAGRISG